MSRTRKIRDPIHGFVEIEGRESDVLDTFIMQRLRGIHQLAMAYLVFPGAVHKRFDHTLGVLSVAGRLCKALNVDNEYTRLIRFAALLHDVGHGPFSHVSESVLDALAPENLSEQAKQKDKIHELITQKIILNHPVLVSCLAGSDREEIARLLSKGLDKSLYRSIISGPLDADKQDYLLRDSFFCGVNYGVYDIEQLHTTLHSVPQGNDVILTADEDGIHALEQFVLAKYYMTNQVYRHRIRLITDQMLIRGLKLGVTQDHIPSLEGLYVYQDTQEYLENYLRWDDQRLVTELLQPEHEQTFAGDMFRRLTDRKLFKLVYRRKLSELPPPLRVALPEIMKKRQQKGEIVENTIAAIEGEIAEHLSSKLSNQLISPDHVILNYVNVGSVRTQSRNSESSISIMRPGGTVRFEEESTLFRSIDEQLNEEFLECYAPVTFPDEREKNELRADMQTWMEEALSQKILDVQPETHTTLTTEVPDESS